MARGKGIMYPGVQVAVPITKPIPLSQVHGFLGRGKGTAKKPGGYPHHSLVNPCTNPLTLAPAPCLVFHAILCSIVGYWKRSLQGFDACRITARVPCEGLMHSTSLQGVSARI
jgi:hypothetical protein